MCAQGRRNQRLTRRNRETKRWTETRRVPQILVDLYEDGFLVDTITARDERHRDSIVFRWVVGVLAID